MIETKIQMEHADETAAMAMDDVAHVVYDNDTEKTINVEGDSYQAMVLDIVSRI
ncbi:hypothetical protein [Anaerolactibacter massiliensis]|uniref:hypothetical protein n=1 Tax=Anaerolactibacter massiliensis TaxID=2044573 RepID=UPI001435667C|nr:hypothetical protein [Anaerolactibacter massiliensis]